MDDALFVRVCEAAGENLSEWIAKACRQRLLSESVRDAVVWEQEHPVEAAAARAAEAAWQREIEAEQEVQYLTEQAWSESGGLGDGPTAEQRADAERWVHALLARADQQKERDRQ
ncbi:hypothetical protein [Nocardia carnea]|uniref:hypothetical protein n=1 Tax=Nocardia carnea TaxID=37328 RepID=UPI000303371F|nr:hypothetical protein [Nocardia carnea]